MTDLPLPGTADPPVGGGTDTAAPRPATERAATGQPQHHPDDRTDDDLPGAPLSSLGDIVADITKDLSSLVRQETELAKAELKQSATRAGKGSGMLAGAGLAGYFMLLFLSVALWWLIGSWITLGWSALVVAAVWAIIAAVLYSRGRAELKRIAGMPKTVETARQIPDAMKGNER